MQIGSRLFQNTYAVYGAPPKNRRKSFVLSSITHMYTNCLEILEEGALYGIRKRESFENSLPVKSKMPDSGLKCNFWP